MGARLILFSDYVKEKEHILNTFNYMGEREGVVINEENLMNDHLSLRILDKKTDAYPSSSAQEKLISNLIEEYPDLDQLEEYDSWQNNKSMYTASVFIKEGLTTLQELAMTNEIYMKYISERPGVEKNDYSYHGLFDQNGSADRNKYLNEIEKHTGNVYRDILSLRLDDAMNLGYDNQKAWKDLLQTKMLNKAELLGIPSNDFRWIAAFHDEGYHPHVHIMSWDSKGSRGFQDRQNIIDFKSMMANEIFKEEMWLKKELKNEIRSDLEDAFKERVHDLNKNILKEVKPDEISTLCDELVKLSKKVNNYGSKYYAYQNQDAKEMTNKIVSNLLYSSSLSPLADQYIKSNVDIASIYLHKEHQLKDYVSSFQKQLIMPRKNDRKVLHNYVVRAAYDIKQRDLQKLILMDHSLKDYDHTMHKNIDVDTDKQDNFMLAIAKIENIRESSTEACKTKLMNVCNDEERVFEVMLEAKENPDIQMKEIKLINKMLNIHLDAADSYNNLQHNTNTLNIHAAGKLVQQFCDVLASDTAQNEQESARMNMIHREDEFFIKKAKFKQK